MPPTTRKKAPAKKAATPRTRKPKIEAPVEEAPVSDAVETPEETPAPKRKGPKPNPFTRLKKAQVAAEKARRKAARATNARAELEALLAAEEEALAAVANAEAEEQAALAALQEAVAAVGVDTDGDE